MSTRVMRLGVASHHKISHPTATVAIPDRNLSNFHNSILMSSAWKNSSKSSTSTQQVRPRFSQTTMTSHHHRPRKDSRLRGQNPQWETDPSRNASYEHASLRMRLAGVS